MSSLSGLMGNLSQQRLYMCIYCPYQMKGLYQEYETDKRF